MKLLIGPILGSAAFSLVALSALTVSAQAPPSGPRPSSSRESGVTSVAVIDVVKVFKNHPRFEAQMEAIKKEIEGLEEEMNRHRADLMKRRDAAAAYEPGSPERRRIEEEALRLMSKLQTDAQLKQQDMMEREAQIYYETYNEVRAEVKRLAEAYNISLVVRFDSEEIDANDRGEVLRGVNRAVVFQRNRDLTGHVIKALRSRYSVGQR